ncbi:NAD-dependent DNA ligase LigA [Pseudoflavitalea sp. G-6-1-2]|uniref:NAD-dependent DNA ligase LigA n=1 Tax=Pseudoflavitalea sp. G-6-1-2 TaxID=2728841 RepID=UPI00146EF06A|nr:NAD-dependent DNA ligase LigA [Pseudoflavitalea sp. G-6-1-2]NML20205.1 NAD-dependent DNA ligase LigA [Pseudoflavitalea sp. G-6-1-2]
MYSPDQTKKLQQLSISLLKQDEKHPDQKNLNDLREVLRFHEHRYYILNDPLIADQEYDKLFKTVEKIEQEHPDLVTPDSPTQRVSKGLTKDFPPAPHLVPMLSLDNSYNEDDLRDWDRRVRELAKTDNIVYCIEPKFDGASISLIYENDLLSRGATRGNGVTGDDITTNIKQIRSVPLSAKFSDYGIQQIEIRGEVLINKTNFKKYNEQLAEQNLPPLANPRNAAAGTLRIKDPKEVGKRNLEAFLYHVSYFTLTPKHTLPEALQSHSGSLQMLWDLGFRSPMKEAKKFNGIEAIIQYCNDFEAHRDDLPYEIDGMVIKVDSIDMQDQLGMTTHHPRWAIAFKFKARQGTSKLRSVEYQVGRTGSVTPVAKIDPVSIGGVTVSSISLFNEDVIREKDLKIGDMVLVERAGDVIPYIVKPLAELRTGGETEIVFPTECPVCGHPLDKPEGEAVWRCNNINCEAQVVERIIHFTSKDAMDIRGLGDANIRKFFELKFLKDLPGIYELPFDQIRAREGFGEKSITNLQTAIEASKSQPLHRLIFALGIRYVGETTAKTLAHAVKYLPDLQNFSLEELQQLEDIGPKVAGSVYSFFHNWDSLEMLKKLESLGLQLKNEQKEIGSEGNLVGQTFLLTGTLPTLKRSEAEELIETNGGKIVGSVSSKLNYLIVGEDAGSKLEKAKKIPTVKIITESEFLQMVNR